MRYAIPLVLFLGLVVFLAIGLGRDPHEVPSPLINRPAPNFQLSQLAHPSKRFSPEEMRGKVWLLNVWATWCFVCREEHPMLLEIARTGEVPIYGLNSKDDRQAAMAWLQDLGDPYVFSVSDSDGRVGIDFGVYGAPETFVIDRNGVIRYKQIGPITPEAWQKQILPLVKELNK